MIIITIIIIVIIIKIVVVRAKTWACDTLRYT